MHLTITNVETQEVLDKCQATDWLEAVQYVERNKLSFLKEQQSLQVAIVNHQSSLICHWTLIPKERPLLLKDKQHVSELTTQGSKSRVRTKAKQNKA